MTDPAPSGPIPLWESDALFQTILSQTAYRTAVDPVRMYLLYQFALTVRALDGDAAEVGVYQGGTARLLATSFRQCGKPVHLFDTFEGMPPVDATKDRHKQGDFSKTSVESVRQYLADMPHVRIYQGIFPGTAAPIENRRFAMVHIDADIYPSVRGSCEFFYPRMNQAGIMVFDDYGAPTCPGARLAVDEFFAGKPERPIYFLTGQAMVIKL